MPSSSQRTPDAGRYRSSRAHLPWSRLEHAERDGHRRRHRRSTPRPPRDPLRADVPLRRGAAGLRHAPWRPALGRSAHRARAAAHVVRGARSHDGRPGARDRRGLEPAAGHLRFRPAARQRLRERTRRAAHRRSRRRTAARQPAGRRLLPHHVAHLDGLEHDAPVRGNRGRPSAARARSPSSPGRAPSSASPDRRSGSLPKTSPPTTRRPIASTS